MKILLPSINLKRTGGVTNFIRLLIDNLLKKNVHIDHFEIGKKINPKSKYMLFLVLLSQIINFKKKIKSYKIITN